MRYFYLAISIGFIYFLVRQIFVELAANERHKLSFPAMYVGEDWHLNEPFWIEDNFGKPYKNPKYIGQYGVYLNEAGQKLKKEMGQ